ncbi:MAG: DUF3429 domain-containing protein [Rhodospirillales bacterium]
MTIQSNPLLTCSTGVPPAAVVLGGAGLLPFAALAMSSHFPWLPAHGLSVTAIVAYGAVIVSFLGGIQWGFAAGLPGSGPDAGKLALSTLPSLMGWSALLVENSVGLLILAASFVGVLLTDIAWHRRGWTPAWYPKLRFPLTLGVVTLLLVTSSAYLRL